jgi:N-acetylmuramoyl-L-alanine amidase
VRDILEKQGQLTRMCRIGNSNVSLSDRTSTANAWGADFFLSLHRNSYANDKANGIETFVYTSASTRAKAVAAAVQSKLVAVGAQNDRGVKTAGFAVLRDSKMPAILIELGFISNAKDNELFDTNLGAYAAAIAAGIMEAFSIQPQPPPIAAEHWAEEHWQSLNAAGVTVHEKRFDDPITRGETFALLERMLKVFAQVT